MYCGSTKIFVLVTIFLVTVSSVHVVLALRSHEATASSWHSNQDAYFINVSGAFRSEKEESLLTDWIRKESDHGNVIISHQESVLRGDPGESLSAEYAVLFVNDAYFGNNRERFSEIWKKINDNPRDIYIISPNHKSINAQDISETLPYAVEDADKENVHMLSYDPSQPVFDYGNSLYFDSASSVGPTLVYLPQEVILHNADSVSAWATQGGALVIDREQAEERLMESGAQSMIHSIKNARIQQAAFAQEAKTNVFLSAYACAVLLILLAFATIEFSRTYASENGQRLFRGYLYGESFTHALRRVLLVEALACVALFGFAFSKIRGFETMNFSYGMTNDENFYFHTLAAICAAIAILASAAVAVMAVRRSYHHQISRRSRDA